MLAVLPPLGNLNNDSSNKQQAEMESFSMILGDDDFADFSAGNMLDNVDFDDLFCDGDVLPDLEMNPDLLAEFSLSSGEDYYSDINTTTATTASTQKTAGGDSGGGGHLSSGIDSESGLMSSALDYSGCISSEGDEETVSKRDPEPAATDEVGLQSKKEVINNVRHVKSNKSNSKALGVSSKGTSKDTSQGKRKVKVDWTPELHRRFVQAVEQLGVDKAVPSRILEIMGIDSLTRHNIASHLQKYRSHRKHLLAREAEAASWSQRRHAYTGPMVVGNGLGKRDRVSPWLVPTVGFPPITSLPPQPLQHGQGHRARPLHVWGHPSVDQTLRPLWPKHLPIQQHHPIWPSPVHQMPRDSPPYWNPQAGPQLMRNGLYPGAPCFPQSPLVTTGSPAQTTVQGILPHAMEKVDPGIGVSPGPILGSLLPLADFHPSMESVDAAIGDVLSKPWLPLPIGLKPPELESVMRELQRNGVPNIPPPSA